MECENQKSQVLPNVEKVIDPRKQTVGDKRKAEPEIFEQQCIVPDLHPMHDLPALNSDDNFNIFQ